MFLKTCLGQGQHLKHIISFLALVTLGEVATSARAENMLPICSCKPLWGKVGQDVTKMNASKATVIFGSVENQNTEGKG